MTDVFGGMFGVPQVCPHCRGELIGAFGQIRWDDGRVQPVMDPNTLYCQRCQTIVPANPLAPNASAQNPNQN